MPSRQDTRFFMRLVVASLAVLVLITMGIFAVQADLLPEAILGDVLAAQPADGDESASAGTSSP